MSVDVPDRKNGNRRPLHTAARADAVRAGALLIEHGADIDRPEESDGSTPLGWAVYFDKRGMIDMLSPLSRDVICLANTGNVTRLRAVLQSEPGLANEQRQGQTALFELPDDEEVALEIAKLTVVVRCRCCGQESRWHYGCRTCSPARPGRSRGTADPMNRTGSATWIELQ